MSSMNHCTLPRCKCSIWHFVLIQSFSLTFNMSLPTTPSFIFRGVMVYTVSCKLRVLASHLPDTAFVPGFSRMDHSTLILKSTTQAGSCKREDLLERKIHYVKMQLPSSNAKPLCIYTEACGTSRKLVLSIS